MIELTVGEFGYFPLIPESNGNLRISRVFTDRDIIRVSEIQFKC